MRVALLAYYFPPIGGAGSQRWLKLTRYLPDSGIDVTVITGPGAGHGRWSPLDETLLEELPPGTEIRRLPGPEPGASGRNRARRERWLGLESPWARWWSHGAAVEAAAAAASGAELVIASMSPYASGAAAAEAARMSGIPWIADLRDPWALDEMMIYPSELHRGIEQRQMGRILATSAGIVTTTPETVSLIAGRFPSLAARTIVSIPNGFDEEDFAGEAPARDDGAFRIVHTGYLHTDVGEQQRRTARTRALLGGHVRGVDILTRSHVYLLEAIDRVLRDGPAPGGGIELHLAGVVSEDDRRLAERFPFTKIYGYVNHAEAIGLMRTADLLFLPMQKMPPGRRSSIVPGKTYEYLAAQRPILAAVPEGDARDILDASGIARICSPDDVAGMASIILRELDRVRRGEPAPVVAEGFLSQFERRSSSARYAKLLTDVVTPKGRPRNARAGRSG